MKTLLYSISFLLLTLQTLSQDTLKVEITNSKDTLVKSSDKLPQKTITISIPKQPKFHSAKVQITLDESKTTMPIGNIFPSAKNTVIVDSANKSQKESFQFSFIRDEKHEKVITFKLSAAKSISDTTTIPISPDVTYSLFIEPYNNDSLKNRNNEFWIFAGTNIDLLDGVQSNNLYARTSFLFPIIPNKPKQQLLYITFEKNRFFSDKDSLSRIPLFDTIFTPRRSDSTTTVTGQYSTFRQIITENVGFSTNYLLNFRREPDPVNNFYVLAGLYVDFQKIKTTYNNVNIITDTAKIKRANTPSQAINSLLTETKINQWNWNAYVGLMYILTASDINLKAFANFGVNTLTYPIVQGSNFSNSLYKNSKNFYFRFHMDATLLTSPGISLGLEVYARTGTLPLFNFTLTKVFDIRQIGSLFGKVPAMQ